MINNDDLKNSGFLTFKEKKDILFRKCIVIGAKQFQDRILIEELLELSHVLLKKQRYSNESRELQEQISEEISHVLICIDLFKEMNPELKPIIECKYIERITSWYESEFLKGDN